MEKNELLRNLSSAQFACVEMNLYLDTHPNDAAALAKFKKYTENANAARRAYVQKCGPITASDVYGNTHFEWVNSPWPWEKEMGE